MRSQTLKRVLLLCLTLPCVLSQREGYKFKRWQQNRFWFWSSEAPMTKALDQLPDVVNGVKMILDHFERLEKQIYARVESRVPPNENVKPCKSTDQRRWPRAVDSSFGAIGFPKPDLSCITDFIGVHLTTHDHPPYTADQLYQATFKRGLAIQKNAKSIASTFIDVENNYTGPSVNFNYPYSTATVQCVLHAVHGVRADGRWRLATGIHNRPILETLTLFARDNIREYHRVVDGHLTDNLLMRVPVRPDTGENWVIRNDTTSFIFNGRGPAIPSMFRNIPISENPAIVESLDKANIFIEQAQDAITPSNIAILVLPLALNIVPIAVFAEVGTIQMLLYIMFTDMLTVIPLLIKGAELINIQSRTHRSVVTRLSSSSSSTPANAAGGEMWAVECQVRDKVREVGIVFVVLSTVFLVGGIMLELAARSYLKRRKRRLKAGRVDAWSKESSNFGKKVCGVWSLRGCKGDGSEDCTEFIGASDICGSERYSSDDYPKSHIGK